MQRPITPEPLPVSFRDASLDGLRALAIMRVVTWHSSGWAWTTWLVSSVPAMFLVTGALLARSFDGQRAMDVIFKKCKRLFPALWLYCAVVFALSVHFDATTSQWWTFVLPLSKPTSTIASEWFTSPLWYLQTYVWVLLFSPLLYKLAIRTTFVLPLCGAGMVLYLGISGRDTQGAGWAIGDIILYATFTTAGMVWLRNGRPHPRSLGITATIFFVATAIWVRTAEPLSSVVNNDHVLHLFVGGFWAAVLLLFPRTLTRFSSTPVARFMNRYPLNIYLWHSMVAWVLWQLMPTQPSGTLKVLTIVVATFLLIPVVTYVVGIIDHRPKQLLKIFSLIPRLAIISVVLTAANTSTVGSRLDFVNRPIDIPLPPSAAPKIVSINVSDEVRKFVGRNAEADVSWITRRDELQLILDRAVHTMSLGGVRAVVTTPDGSSWHITSGKMKGFDEPSLIGSLTKTFTTSLVMQMVADKKISLNDQIGALGINFEHSQITIGQLLNHTSGIPKFRSQAGAVADGTTPTDMARYVSAQPLRFVPGTRVEYSTSGFAILGIFLEQVTGMTFESLLRSRLTDPLGYDITTFRGRYASVGFSTGGISMRMDDLADWSRRYFFNRTTTDSKWDWSINETTGTGVHGYCPCRDSSFMALGHIGGRTFASADGDGTIVVIDSAGVLVLGNYKKSQTLAQELRLIAGGGKTPLVR